MTNFCFSSRSESDTDRLGMAIASSLRAGDVIALNGELGAGKTRLTRAIVVGLDGAEAPVNSPTFVIVQRYDVRLTVHHIDAYRLVDIDEFMALGGDEILESDSVCLIEWASRIADVLPIDHVDIDIVATGAESRRFELHGAGLRSDAFVAQVRNTIA